MNKLLGELSWEGSDLRLSKAKIYDLAQKSQIPCTKIAGQWRFRRGEIDQWMLDQRDHDSSGRESPEAASNGDP